MGGALGSLVCLAVVAATAPAAQAATAPATDPASGSPTVRLEINGPDGTPASAVVILLAVTVLSVAPGVLLLMTSFTKILVVLALTRNALGLQTSPPTQVLTGLALFLTVFVMTPTLGEINEVALQPYLDGRIGLQAAVDAGVAPLREFMLAHTRGAELALMSQAADLPIPDSRDAVPLSTLVPAFVLSELRSAFVIGFVVFVPFLVIDLVVSSALMSMGIMMLPPVVISMPFKLLLFVLVDGWGLLVTALVGSYR
jgi:flagellar biosynthetic protein FliP